MQAVPPVANATILPANKTSEFYCWQQPYLLSQPQQPQQQQPQQVFIKYAMIRQN